MALSDGDEERADSARFAQAPGEMPPSFAPATARNARRSHRSQPVAEQITPLIDRGAAEESKGQHLLSSILQTVTVFAVALLSVVIIKAFFVQFFFVPSGSMETTIMTGDYVAVNKLADSLDELNRGDIIVFQDPGGWLDGVQQSQPNPVTKVLTDVGQAIGLVPKNSGTHLVKRIIGVAGDHVSCAGEGEPIVINGAPVQETYLAPDMAPSLQAFDVTVPKGHLWVMGDNRSNSADSRYHQERNGFGFVPIAKVEGRVWLIYYPFNHFRHVRSGADVFADVPAAKAVTAGTPSN